MVHVKWLAGKLWLEVDHNQSLILGISNQCCLFSPTIDSLICTKTYDSKHPWTKTGHCHYVLAYRWTWNSFGIASLIIEIAVKNSIFLWFTILQIPRSKFFPCPFTLNSIEHVVDGYLAWHRGVGVVKLIIHVVIELVFMSKHIQKWALCIHTAMAW